MDSSLFLPYKLCKPRIRNLPTLLMPFLTKQYISGLQVTMPALEDSVSAEL